MPGNTYYYHEMLSFFRSREEGEGIMILWSEDFSSGFFETGDIGSKADWFYYKQQDFLAKDPQTRISFRKNRLEVVIPQYTLTSEGRLDHLKFLFFKNILNKETGMPGFPVPDEGELKYEIVAQFTPLGTDSNPFEAPDDDYRLSSGGLISLDFETFTVYGFLISCNRVYILYERWPFDTSVDNPAAFFTYIIPCREIEPSSEHAYRMVYNKDTYSLTWFIDDDKVFSWDQFGKRLGEEHEEYCAYRDFPNTADPEALLPIRAGQRVFGAGLFTFLDAGSRHDSGLVDITDRNVKKEQKIFGQGGELVLGHFTVSTS